MRQTLLALHVNRVSCCVKVGFSCYRSFELTISINAFIVGLALLVDAAIQSFVSSVNVVYGESVAIHSIFGGRGVQ